jgi:hypothetical protein
MMVFPVGAEHALDVPVQRPHNADPCTHHEIAAFGGTDQTADRGLPNVRAVCSKTAN